MAQLLAVQLNSLIVHLLRAHLRTTPSIDSHCGTHSNLIDFLEFKHNAKHVQFRNKRKELHLLALESEEPFALLAYCMYAQWIPIADVVVASMATVRLCDIQSAMLTPV